jgi:hypothetical protein
MRKPKPLDFSLSPAFRPVSLLQLHTSRFNGLLLLQEKHTRKAVENGW